MRLADLPERLRIQAMQQLGMAVKSQPISPIAPLCSGSTAVLDAARAGSNPAGATNAIRIATPRQPNKTEAAFNREFLRGAGRYECIRLRLAGGEHYTPDFMVERDGRVELYEVKGSYKLHSHGAAAVRFKEAAAQFPEFRFIWAYPDAKRGWIVQEAVSNRHSL